MLSGCRIYKLWPCKNIHNISSHVHRQTDEAGRNILLCIIIIISSSNIIIIIIVTPTIMYRSARTQAPRNHYYQAEMEKRNEASSQERDPKAECKLLRRAAVVD